MPTTTCPNCDFQLAQSVGKDVREEVPVYVFDCEECGHEWTKPI